ncbi:MAG: YjbQ family protein [Firmicutes bacterium]|nr:YjbQ family protein [Bacillota bacterium]
MLYQYELSTAERGFYDITEYVNDALRKSGVKSGICVVYCPHTTAAITINENADPDVVKDLLFSMETYFPDRPEYRHREGNSYAHLRCSLMGASETVIIDKGHLVLGTWQGIYFVEFDGPRPHRKFYVKMIAD